MVEGNWPPSMRSSATKGQRQLLFDVRERRMARNRALLCCGFSVITVAGSSRQSPPSPSQIIKKPFTVYATRRLSLCVRHDWLPVDRSIDNLTARLRKKIERNQSFAPSCRRRLFAFAPRRSYAFPDDVASSSPV
jgi:hypothetical protein